MKAAVVTFPGSNCDRDLAVAFERAGAQVTRVWHKDADLPAGLDVVGIPGGFSFGDYLRCGAIAAQSPVAAAVKRFAERGGYVLGICNGFQVLTETGLLPGALMRNAGINFICRTVKLRVATADSGPAAARRRAAIRAILTRRGSAVPSQSPMPQRGTLPDETAQKVALPPRNGLRPAAGGAPFFKGGGAEGDGGIGLLLLP